MYLNVFKNILLLIFAYFYELCKEIPLLKKEKIKRHLIE